MSEVNSTSSPLLYTAGGAIAGGLAGAATAHFDVPYASYKSQAYNSWQEAVEDVNKDDQFIKNVKDKGSDEAKTAATTIAEKAKAVKEAEEAYKTELGKIEDLKGVNQENLNKYIDATTALAEKEKAELESLVELAKNKDGKIKINDNGSIVEKSIKELLTGFTEQSGEGAKPYAEQVAEFLKSDGKQAELENVLKNSVTFKDAIKAESEAVTTAAGEVKINDKAVDNLSNKVGEALVNARKNVKDAAKKAEEGITSEVLGKIKKPSMRWTAAIGAVVAGALGYLLTPKSDEA